MTTASFTLTKEMREKIVDQLTVQAVSKHAKKIAATLGKLNDDFWDQHRDAVDAVLQIDRSRWAMLIQSGIVTATSQAVPKVEKIGTLVRFPKAVYNDKADEYSEKTRRTVITSSAFSGVFEHLHFDGYRTLELRFRSKHGSTPRLNDMETLVASSGMATKAAKVRKDLAAVFEAANEFHKQATDILNSCRTSRQLVDLFPEAAKLLPEPVKRKTELAPVDLVNSVREQLKNGVPNISA